MTLPIDYDFLQPVVSGSMEPESILRFSDNYFAMGDQKKPRWKFSIHKTRDRKQNQNPIPCSVPPEFLCPISASIMADPVIVASGHSFERRCVDACIHLAFKPKLNDENDTVADLSTVIPNLALKSAILSWCRQNHVDTPEPVEFQSAVGIVRQLISQLPTKESAGGGTPPTAEIFATRASLCSSDADCSNSDSMEEDEQVLEAKLETPLIHEQEEALVTLRLLTRTREESRARLCTPRLLSAVKPLLNSKHSSLQVNAVAALVNLSLENLNKVKILRFGFVPQLIEVLKSGFPESRDHAAGALFSLSMDDENKAAIGVLGALPPLLHALRSESEPTRNDSALALYHLSMVQSNRMKLIKLGAVQIFLGMVKSRHMLGLVMLILCNLSTSPEGRAAMLDGGALKCLLSVLNRVENESTSVRKSCLSTIYGLSYGGRMFKGLAKEARAEELLMNFEKRTESQWEKEKVSWILEALREKHEEEEGEVNWEELLNIDEGSV